MPPTATVPTHRSAFAMNTNAPIDALRIFRNAVLLTTMFTVAGAVCTKSSVTLRITNAASTTTSATVRNHDHRLRHQN